MKRKLTWLMLLVLTASLFVGCGKTPSYTVTFDLNGGELISGEIDFLTQKAETSVSAFFPVLIAFINIYWYNKNSSRKQKEGSPSCF